MNNIVKDFLIGTFTSFVPLYLMSYQFDDKDCIKNAFSFPNAVRTLPIFFGISGVVAFYLFRLLGIHNFFLIGVIFAIYYSSIGRFYANIPTRVFELENPNMFHVYAVIIWGLFFGFIVRFLYNYIC